LGEVERRASNGDELRIYTTFIGMSKRFSPVVSNKAARDCAFGAKLRLFDVSLAGGM
jgi:hypothetical protein